MDLHDMVSRQQYELLQLQRHPLRAATPASSVSGSVCGGGSAIMSLEDQQQLLPAVAASAAAMTASMMMKDGSMDPFTLRQVHTSRSTGPAALEAREAVCEAVLLQFQQQAAGRGGTAAPLPNPHLPLPGGGSDAAAPGDGVVVVTRNGVRHPPAPLPASSVQSAKHHLPQPSDEVRRAGL